MQGISREKIVQFFHNECSREDAIEIRNYLQSHPEILADYFNWEDWKETRTYEQLIELSSEEKDLLWKRINSKIRKPIVLARYASVIAIVVALIFAIRWDRSNLNTGKLDNKSNLVIRNEEKYIKRIVLNDKSVVDLYPNGILIVDSNYNILDRKLRVIGTGIFKVAKNRGKPFIVQSSVVKTMAIGTVFQVDEESGKGKIVVRLMEGHIKVMAGMDAVFLYPGDSIVYNTALGKFLPNSKRVRLNGPFQDNKVHTPIRKTEQTDSNIWYRFDNQPLEEVFNRLSVLYNVRIDYVNYSRDTLYFIGKFKETDQLSRILSTISKLNNLELLSTGDSSYKIIKRL